MRIEFLRMLLGLVHLSMQREASSCKTIFTSIAQLPSSISFTLSRSQSPTFNASPVVSACLDACKRDITVTLYLDLGFNDLGETIPFQGGTNQSVVSAMYGKLKVVGKEENLKVYWYTGKDQGRPMNASEKKRNCHGLLHLSLQTKVDSWLIDFVSQIHVGG